jgi:7-cyano-7-deazaguanine synthase
MRNLLFLVIAANRAACLGINTMVVGVCQEDFGGYPDCRQVFVDAAEEAIEKALNLNSTEEGRFAILAPLMNMSKRESVEFAMDLPFAMEALSYTHTCYAGEFPPCGHCHACLLRARGFGEAGIIDPIYERLAMEEMRRRS